VAKTGAGRPRGTIRKRGKSLQVTVYAGIDPLTGKRMFLSDSTTDPAEAERIRKRLVAQVDDQRSPRTRTTFGNALEAWLRTHEAEETTLDGYRGYVRRTIEPALGDVPIGKITPQVLEEFYADLRRCRHRCRGGEPAVDHRTSAPHECRTVRHRRRPGRPGPEPHDCVKAGCVVVECPPHRCTPMAASSIRQIHWILSAALAAALRWEWIRSNPADIAKKPKQRAPQPEPPSVDEAARILVAAWEQDDDWGALVWLVMTTGMRRGELLALRWSDVDLMAKMLTIRRNYVRSSRRGVEKDTKTHQMRRISLDPETVAVLTEHRQRYEERVRALGEAPNANAFLLSHQPLADAPADSSAVTHRYGSMCAKLGIDSHLHALRHYSATELLTAGS
jgi:integrase